MERRRRGGRRPAPAPASFDHKKFITDNMEQLFKEEKLGDYIVEIIEQMKNTKRAEYLVKVFNTKDKEVSYQFAVETTPSGSKIKKFGDVVAVKMEEADKVEEEQPPVEEPPKRGRGRGRKSETPPASENETTTDEPQSIESFAVVESTSSKLSAEDRLDLTGMQIAKGISDLLEMMEEDGDDEALQEQLELFSRNLVAKGMSYFNVINILKSETEHIKDMKKTVDKALKVKNGRTDKFKKLIKNVMLETGTKNIKTDLGSMYLTEKQSFKVYDAAKVPLEYVTHEYSGITIPSENLEEVEEFLKSKGCGLKGALKNNPNTDKINEDLWVNGKSIDGIHKDYNVSLTVRGKQTKKED